jgi:hypothetical protein
MGGEQSFWFRTRQSYDGGGISCNVTIGVVCFPETKLGRLPVLVLPGGNVKKESSLLMRDEAPSAGWFGVFAAPYGRRGLVGSFRQCPNLLKSLSYFAATCGGAESATFQDDAGVSKPRRGYQNSAES